MRGLLLALSVLAAGSLAAEPMQGRLTLETAQASTDFEIVLDRDGLAEQSSLRVRQLPSFSFDFVQDDNFFIPMQTGPVANAHPMWEYLIGVGTITDAANGARRVSLPLSLQERNANCVHNGMLLFQMQANGSIDDASFTVASETCAYFQWNMQARMPGQFESTQLPAATAVVQRHRANRRARLPLRSFASLAQLHDDVAEEDFANAAKVAPASLTVYGLVLDGEHYLGGCATRSGEYQPCEELFLPSYSTAKSLFAAVALMRLEQLFPGAAQARVSDYVDECSDLRWQDVRFVDLLNMATGNYLSSHHADDETNPELVNAFHLPETHVEKIRVSCDGYPRQVAPARRWVYHTTDTYVLSTAMNAYLRRHLDPGADVYEELLLPLWRELELSPALDTTRRTRDAEQQAFAGYGLTFLPDDLARISLALQSEAFSSRLDSALFDSALQRMDTLAGMPAVAGMYYSNGFFAQDLGRTLACDGGRWTPVMSGYGGIRVALLGEGRIFYYFSDGGVHDFAAPLRAVHRVTPLC